MGEIKQWDCQIISGGNERSKYIDDYETSIGRYVRHEDHIAAMREEDAEIAAGESNIAEAMRTIADNDRQVQVLWEFCQRVSPWNESNDMLWSDELNCSISLLLQRAERAEAQRDALLSACKAFPQEPNPYTYRAAHANLQKAIAKQESGE